MILRSAIHPVDPRNGRQLLGPLCRASGQRRVKRNQWKYGMSAGGARSVLLTLVQATRPVFLAMTFANSKSNFDGLIWIGLCDILGHFFSVNYFLKDALREDLAGAETPACNRDVLNRLLMAQSGRRTRGLEAPIWPTKKRG